MVAGQDRRGTGHVLVWLDPVGSCRRGDHECLGDDASRTGVPEDSALLGLAAPDFGDSPSCLLAKGILVSVALSKGAELSKLDLAIVVALVAGCAFWIERGQRVVIDAPTQSELAAAAIAAAACPDNDSMPYSVDCILFMSGTNWRMSEETTTAASQPARPAEVSPPAAGPPCPDRDTVPYSDACLAYLQGATSLGMRWRIRAPPMPAPLDAPTPVATASGASGNK